MQIKTISLENFRSYAKKSFGFSPGITAVVGPNTAGKSNLLEAIFLLAFGRSPRAQLDREMLREGEKLAFVRATAYGSDPRDLEVIVTETGKKFRVNGVGRRLSDFSQHFHVVLFSPEDLNLVIGSPDLRRRFLDFALGSVEPVYARISAEYDKVRRRRNRLLSEINKNPQFHPDNLEGWGLEFWDAKLLEYGVAIQDRRKEFFDEINSRLAPSRLLLVYLPSGLTAERLREYRPREIVAETSLIGPHRDDFVFQQDGRDLVAYGSRGEQRRAVLALKAAELAYVQQRIGSRPVLLLDDIFSELDEENRAKVFDLIGEGQTIITTTDLHHIPPELQSGLQIIEL